MLTYPDHAGASLWHNLERSARRFPDKPALVFRGHAIRYREVLAQTEALAAWLRTIAGVAPGDRVLLMLPNCPQWLIACYGILRADAVVVPVSTMNRDAELSHVIADSEPVVAVVAREYAARLEQARRGLRAAGSDTLRRILIGDADDWLDPASGSFPFPEASPPETMSAQRVDDAARDHHDGWLDAIAAGQGLSPLASTASRDDLAFLPYTSGTTGLPKGCMHPHRTVMHNVLAAAGWSSYSSDTVSLSVLPLYHVAGMLAGCHTPFFHGATSVMLARWNREQAAALIARHRVSYWSCITTMMIDFLASPALDQWDLSSIETIGGGGAAMPAAIAERLKARTGIVYMEGYGLTETFGATHRNPRDAPKFQCLGVPFTGTRARIVEPDTGAVLPDERAGEIVVNGPQVFDGYWRNPQASADAFLTLEGERWLRTGDLGRRDADGYYFLVDRLKRMINASGFKVWPAEIEAMLHRHPAVLEPCVVAIRDAYRGESVKAVIVLRPEVDPAPTPDDIIDWCRAHMATYKVPRVVEFVEALPKSGAGKVLWRELQQL